MLITVLEAFKYAVNLKQFFSGMNILFAPRSGEIFWRRGLLAAPFRQFCMYYQAFRVANVSCRYQPRAGRQERRGPDPARGPEVADP